jgi:hypothetical protein
METSLRSNRPCVAFPGPALQILALGLLACLLGACNSKRGLPQVTYKVLSARGFDVGEYSASVNEQFVANDPEGNEVFIGSVRPQAPWDGWSNKSFKPNPLRGSA